MEIRLASRVIASLSGRDSKADGPLDLAAWQADLSNDISTLALLAQDDEALPDHEFDPLLDGGCRHAMLLALLARALGVADAVALEVGLCAELFHAAAFSNDDLESYRRPFYAAHGGQPPMRQDPRRLISIDWYRRTLMGQHRLEHADRSVVDVFAEPERVALAVRAWCLWAGSAAMARSSLPRLLTIGGRLQAGAVRLMAACSHRRDGAELDRAVEIGLCLGKLWALERLHTLRHWNVQGRTPNSPADEAEEALFASLCRREAQASAESALGLVAVMSMSPAVRLTLDEFIKSQSTRVMSLLASADQLRSAAGTPDLSNGPLVPGLAIEESSGAALSPAGKEQAHVV